MVYNAQDWAFYPHTNQGVLAAAVMIDDMTHENAPMMVASPRRNPQYDIISRDF